MPKDRIITFITETLGAKTIYIIDDKTTYGQGLSTIKWSQLLKVWM